MNGYSNGYSNGTSNGVANGVANGNGIHECDLNNLKRYVQLNGDHYKSEVLSGSADLKLVPRTDSNIDNHYTYELLQAIATYLLERTHIRPKIGIICGSGLGSLAESLTDKTCYPYSTIPHFPTSTVPGHAGQLLFGCLNGVQVMCMQGRFHSYEGYPLWKCSMPVRVMHLVGVTHVIVTNAAGGLNEDYRTGDIMIIKDHINLMGFAGNNPLQGANDGRFGPRFLPMNMAYDSQLRQLCKSVGDKMGISNILREGVYTCVGGPNFETVAELQMLKKLGVDAVGMSTVPEVLMARHCGMKVFGFSLITNECIVDYDSPKEANHQEVMDTGDHRKEILKELVRQMVTQMGAKILSARQANE